MMQTIMQFLGQNAVILQAFATIGLLFATVVLAWATVKLAKSSSESTVATELLAAESKKERKAANSPRVLARLRPYSEHGDFINLVVMNVGRGPALELKIEVRCNEQDFTAHDVSAFRGTAVPICFLSSGESDEYSLGTSKHLFDDPPMEPFEVVLSYKDLDGESHNELVKLDVKQFKGLAWQGASVAWRQMAALEQIKEILNRIQSKTADLDILAK